MLQRSLALAALLLAFPLAAETATRPDVPSPYVETTVITGLIRPVALAFLPDGRLLIAEQGRPAYDEAFLKLWDPNTSSITTYATVSGADLYANTEAGLIGLAVDPNYAANRYVYAFLTRNTTEQVVRRFHTGPDGRTSDGFVDVIRNLPTAGANHNGGGLLIHGGYLYVGVGENGDDPSAQLLSSRRGKVLRFNLDGTIPPGNPFVGVSGADPAIYSYGHRNPVRLAARGNQIFVSDVGPAGHDEINLLVPGGNFGWPTFVGYTNQPGYVSPTWEGGFNQQHTPVDLVFYNSTAMPLLTGSLFFAEFMTGKVMRAQVNPAGTAFMAEPSIFVSPPTDPATGQPIIEGPVDIEVAPDGSIYYSLRGGMVNRVTLDHGGGNAAPLASFTLTPDTGTVPLTVAAGSTSSDPDGTISNYRWDWGDGSPPSSGSGLSTPTHTYASTGTFTLTLTVTDDDGATASANRNVVVNPPGSTNTSPSSHVEDASPPNGPAPLAVTFTGHGHDNDVGDRLGHEWNFGDGSPTVSYPNMAPDAASTPSHTFTSPGSYIVTLRITDTGGLTATHSIPITVGPPPGPGTGGSRSSACGFLGLEAVVLLVFLRRIMQTGGRR